MQHRTATSWGQAVDGEGKRALLAPLFAPPFLPAALSLPLT